MTAQNSESTVSSDVPQSIVVLTWLLVADAVVYAAAGIAAVVAALRAGSAVSYLIFAFMLCAAAALTLWGAASFRQRRKWAWAPILVWHLLLVLVLIPAVVSQWWWIAVPLVALYSAIGVLLVVPKSLHWIRGGELVHTT